MELKKTITMGKPNFTKLTEPSGKEITFEIRTRFFLVVNTNFNPFSHIDFAEINIRNIEGIASMEVINKYDEDESGFYIFRLKRDYVRDTVIQGLSDQFQEYFIEQ